MRRAATDERTGDVREMRTRKEPEKAVARERDAWLAFRSTVCGSDRVSWVGWGTH